MFPPEFEYRRAETVEEALDLLASNEDAVPLAGGHSLIPDMKNREARPATVVDLQGIGSLAGIDDDGDETRIGALTTYADLLDADPFRGDARVLVEAASKLGDRQIRNRGTVGGNLVQSEPGADLPAAAIAADATLEVVDRTGDRRLDADEFLSDGGPGVEATALLTAVRVPDREGAGAYVKKTHPATGYALVGVAAVLRVEAGTVTDARVAANGLRRYPVRLGRVEEALVGETAAAIPDAAERAAAGLDPHELRSDPQVSGEFRANVLSVYGEEALSTAFDRASRGE